MRTVNLIMHGSDNERHVVGTFNKLDNPSMSLRMWLADKSSELFNFESYTQSRLYNEYKRLEFPIKGVVSTNVIDDYSIEVICSKRNLY